MLWVRLAATAVSTLPTGWDAPCPDGTYRGALKVDGELYCPALPAGLHELPDAHYRNRAQMDRRAQVAERREPYLMLPLTQPDDNGAQRVQCPALRGKVRCPLREASLALDPADHVTVVQPPTAPGACCTQKSLTVQAATLGGIKQKHPYGSAEHKASFDRRNVVEGIAGYLKSSGGADVKRDHIRVMGLSGVTLLLSLAVAAMNVRLLAKHLDAHDDGTDKDDDIEAPPATGSYDDVIDTDRTFTARRRTREAARAGADPPQVA